MTRLGLYLAIFSVLLFQSRLIPLRTHQFVIFINDNNTKMGQNQHARIISNTVRCTLRFPDWTLLFCLKVDGWWNGAGHHTAAYQRQAQHIHLHQSPGWVYGAAGARQAQHSHHQTFHSGSQLAGAFSCESTEYYNTVFSDWFKPLHYN